MLQTPSPLARMKSIVNIAESEPRNQESVVNSFRTGLALVKAFLPACKTGGYKKAHPALTGPRPC
jgi:hypothetical protein